MIDSPLPMKANTIKIVRWCLAAIAAALSIATLNAGEGATPSTESAHISEPQDSWPDWKVIRQYEAIPASDTRSAEAIVGRIAKQVSQQIPNTHLDQLPYAQRTLKTDSDRLEIDRRTQAAALDAAKSATKAEAELEQTKYDALKAELTAYGRSIREASAQIPQLEQEEADLTAALAGLEQSTRERLATTVSWRIAVVALGTYSSSQRQADVQTEMKSCAISKAAVSPNAVEWVEVTRRIGRTLAPIGISASDSLLASVADLLGLGEGRSVRESFRATRALKATQVTEGEPLVLYSQSSRANPAMQDIVMAHQFLVSPFPIQQVESENMNLSDPKCEPYTYQVYSGFGDNPNHARLEISDSTAIVRWTQWLSVVHESAEIARVQIAGQLPQFDDEWQDLSGKRDSVREELKQQRWWKDEAPSKRPGTDRELAVAAESLRIAERANDDAEQELRDFACTSITLSFPQQTMYNHKGTRSQDELVFEALDQAVRGALTQPTLIGAEETNAGPRKYKATKSIVDVDVDREILSFKVQALFKIDDVPSPSFIPVFALEVRVTSRVPQEPEPNDPWPGSKSDSRSCTLFAPEFVSCSAEGIQGEVCDRRNHLRWKPLGQDPALVLFDHPMTWDRAESLSRSTPGYSGSSWRLPSKCEMGTFVASDQRGVVPVCVQADDLLSGASMGPMLFAGMACGRYWTSSEANRTGAAIAVDLRDGTEQGYDKLVPTRAILVGDYK